ncbi:pol [Symbiodinium sp. CCMP2592]|nr:pol [Symbiodinium sp. CCMP2592]
MKLLDLAAADSEIVMAQEIARGKEGWDRVNTDEFVWISHRHREQWRGVAVGIAHDRLDCVIHRIATPRGIWVLLRLHGLGRVVCGSFHAHTGTTNVIYQKAVGEFFSKLPAKWKHLPLFCGVDANEVPLWDVLESNELEIGHCSTNLNLMLGEIQDAGCRVLPPGIGQRTAPTHFPRDETREGRQIDLLFVRKVGCEQVIFDADRRHTINTDHAFVFSDVFVNGPLPERRWGNDSRARWVTGTIPDSVLVDAEDITCLARAHTRPRRPQAFRDSEETRSAIKEAKIAKSKAAWKRVHRLRRRDRTEWEDARLRRILLRGWEEFRSLQNEKKKKKGWWGDMLDGKPSAVLTKEVQQHLAGKMITPDKANWDDELDEIIKTVPNEGDFVDFTILEVRTELRQMRCRSAIGPDGISVHLLRELASHDSLSDQLVGLINHIVKTQETPENWNVSFLALLAKCSCPRRPKDLRPICVSSAFNKLVNRLVCMRALPKLRRGSCISACGRGRQAADLIGGISRIRDVIHEWRMPALLCKLDVAGAFDRVDRNKVASLLCERLSGERLSSELRFLLGQLHTHELVGTVPGGNEIRLRPNNGIKQGAPESAEIFGILIDSLLSDLVACRGWNGMPGLAEDFNVDLLFYQDDVFLVEQDLGRLIKRIRIVDRCLGTAGLSLATEKTMIIASPQYRGPRSAKIGDDYFSIAAKEDSLRALGVSFNFHESPSQQAQEMLGRARAAAASHADILGAHGPWTKKVDMLRYLVESTWSWSAGALHWSSQDLHAANTLQLHLLRKAFKLRRLADESFSLSNTIFMVTGQDVKNLIGELGKRDHVCLCERCSGEVPDGGVDNRRAADHQVCGTLVGSMPVILNVKSLTPREVIGSLEPLIGTPGASPEKLMYTCGMLGGPAADNLLFASKNSMACLMNARLRKPAPSLAVFATAPPFLMAPIFRVLALLWFAWSWCTAAAWDEESDDERTGGNEPGQASSSSSSRWRAPASTSTSPWTYQQYVEFMAVAWDENVSLAAQEQELRDYEDAFLAEESLLSEAVIAPCADDLPLPFSAVTSNGVTRDEEDGSVGETSNNIMDLLSDGRQLRGGRPLSCGEDDRTAGRLSPLIPSVDRETTSSCSASAPSEWTARPSLVAEAGNDYVGEPDPWGAVWKDREFAVDDPTTSSSSSWTTPCTPLTWSSSPTWSPSSRATSWTSASSTNHAPLCPALQDDTDCGETAPSTQPSGSSLGAEHVDEGWTQRFNRARPGRDRWHNADGSIRVRLQERQARQARLDSIAESDPAFTIEGIENTNEGPIAHGKTFYGEHFTVSTSGMGAIVNDSTSAGEDTTTPVEESDDLDYDGQPLPGPVVNSPDVPDVPDDEMTSSSETSATPGEVGFWRHGVWVGRPRTPAELRDHRGGGGMQRWLKNQRRMREYFRGQWRPAWLVQYARDKAGRQQQLSSNATTSTPSYDAPSMESGGTNGQTTSSPSNDPTVLSTSDEQTTSWSWTWTGWGTWTWQQWSTWDGWSWTTETTTTRSRCSTSSSPASLAVDAPTMVPSLATSSTSFSASCTTTTSHSWSADSVFGTSCWNAESTTSTSTLSTTLPLPPNFGLFPDVHPVGSSVFVPTVVEESEEDSDDDLQLTNAERRSLEERGVTRSMIDRLENLMRSLDRMQDEGRGPEGRLVEGIDALEAIYRVLSRRFIPQGYLPVRRIPHREEDRWRMFNWARNYMDVFLTTLEQHLNTRLQPADSEISPMAPADSHSAASGPSLHSENADSSGGPATSTTPASSGSGTRRRAARRRARRTRSRSPSGTTVHFPTMDSEFALNSADELVEVPPRSPTLGPFGPPPPLPVNLPTNFIGEELQGIWREPSRDYVDKYYVGMLENDALDDFYNVDLDLYNDNLDYDDLDFNNVPHVVALGLPCPQRLNDECTSSTTSMTLQTEAPPTLTWPSDVIRDVVNTNMVHGGQVDVIETILRLLTQLRGLRHRERLLLEAIEEALEWVTVPLEATPMNAGIYERAILEAVNREAQFGDEPSSSSTHQVVTSPSFLLTPNLPYSLPNVSNQLPESSPSTLAGLRRRMWRAHLANLHHAQGREPPLGSWPNEDDEALYLVQQNEDAEIANWPAGIPRPRVLRLGAVRRPGGERIPRGRRRHRTLRPPPRFARPGHRASDLTLNQGTLVNGSSHLSHRSGGAQGRHGGDSYELRRRRLVNSNNDLDYYRERSRSRDG